MGIKIKSTKSFRNLPAAHAQYFDMTPDGKPGACAAAHGYDREVTFTFAGEVDQYGWCYPFGNLKQVRAFLDFYFDHVLLLGADDPRLDTLSEDMLECGGLLGTLRVLPYGVSMEMSSLFIWEAVNPFIYHSSGGRVWVEKVESREHEKNSAFVEVDGETAINQAKQYRSDGSFLETSPWHQYESPHDAIARLTCQV